MNEPKTVGGQPDLPEPPVPRDADLRSVRGIGIDLADVLKSEEWIFASGAEAKASITLRLQSYLQIPAGSLPDDDAMLARLAMVGHAWGQVRAHAMRGWMRHSDGRLYHAKVAAKVTQLWRRVRRNHDRFNNRLSVFSAEWDRLRTEVYRRDAYTCRYCGQKGGSLECDHVVPVSRGGDSTLDNLVTACRACNRSKGSKLLKEWRP